MVMDSKLFVKVSQREERVDRIEAFPGKPDGIHTFGAHTARPAGMMC